MLQQSQPTVPPKISDRTLQDFSQTIQGSFAALFQAAHIHQIRTTFPGTRDGSPGDIYLINDNGNYWIFTKISKTQWIKFGPGVSL